MARRRGRRARGMALAAAEAAGVEEDPAESLRAKLEESRAVVDERDRFEERETPVDEAADPEARRQSVHEEARARIDELRGE